MATTRKSPNLSPTNRVRPPIIAEGRVGLYTMAWSLSGAGLGAGASVAAAALVAALAGAAEAAADAQAGGGAGPPLPAFAVSLPPAWSSRSCGQLAKQQRHLRTGRTPLPAVTSGLDRPELAALALRAGT